MNGMHLKNMTRIESILDKYSNKLILDKERKLQNDADILWENIKLKYKVQRDVVDKHGFEVLENLQAGTDEAYEKVIDSTKKLAAYETKDTFLLDKKVNDIHRDLGKNIGIMLQQDGFQNQRRKSMYEIDETN